ncbi:uncharacterized protein LOC124458761 isoform X3 [Xenia sp. Carnegie-2017]|uniref:uncharacterized protein LOC124458761 isoform X3 n=1 Tax=Xenia sp. Carnegie-2017 TaxID=2897299 RepID=UPI001F047BB8|nr:uncharacterized protein LOC124458761 isoform X3 [Xenia sp. Carnegie-2017]
MCKLISFFPLISACMSILTLSFFLQTKFRVKMNFRSSKSSSLQLLHAHTYDVAKDFEEWSRSVGAPAPAPTLEKCKKDMVILLDTSYSIGKHRFNKNVKKFLKNLVSSPKLNVGRDGTQIAIVIFSNKRNTRVVLPFSGRTKAEYKKFIDKKLSWRAVSGGRTMTGTGAGIVDKQIFKKNSPLNNRPNIADVVLLITDGEPRGRKVGDELKDAYKYSSAIKDKDILIVGVAVGDPSIVKKFKPVIKKMSTSEKTTFDSKFDSLDKILSQIVDASCTPFKPGDCSCSSIQSKPMYIKPPATTVTVSWPLPTLQCRNNRIPKHTTTAIKPNITSPHSFTAGDYPIEYTYTFRGGFDLKCYVNITIKACTCPSPVNVITYASSNFGSTAVQYRQPRPTCSSTLKTAPARKQSGSKFVIGKHSLDYLYSTIGGFDLTCRVNIDVRGCSCPNIHKTVIMQPDSPNGRVNVSWSEPKCNCSSQGIDRLTVKPNIKPGASFGVGNHVIRYSYDLSNGVNVQCSVNLTVRVVPCQGLDYDPATHVCCCGKIRAKKPHYKCCGRKQYNVETHQCCSTNYNIVEISQTCPGS